MSYEVSNINTLIRYVNFKERGTGRNFCHSTLKFRYPLLEKADSYMCSVERFRIPLNAIPLNDALVAAVTLHPVVPGPDIIYNINVTFSIGAFFSQLNSLHAGLQFIVLDDGRIRVLFNDWTTYYVEFSQIVADILNFPLFLGDPGGATPNNTSFDSTAVIFDKIDQLEDVRLEIVGLPTESEYISSTVEGFVISDFISSPPFTMSKTGSNAAPLGVNHVVSYVPRQDLILDAKERRFINIKGAQPIYNMDIKAFAIYRDGSKHEIALPPRSVFSVKIAFYRKY